MEGIKGMSIVILFSSTQARNFSHYDLDAEISLNEDVKRVNEKSRGKVAKECWKKFIN